MFNTIITRGASEDSVSSIYSVGIDPRRLQSAPVKSLQRSDQSSEQPREHPEKLVQELGRPLFRSRWGWRGPGDRRHDSATSGGCSGDLSSRQSVLLLQWRLLGAARRTVRRRAAPLRLMIVGGLLVSQRLTVFTTLVIYLYLDQLMLRVHARGGSASLGSLARASPNPRMKGRAHCKRVR